MPRDTQIESVAKAVGKIPSGLAVLTAVYGERATAMLASWIQQASFEPLMVTVCVKRGRPIESLLDDSGRFVLNILGGEPKTLLKHFARGFAADADAFAGLDVTNSEYGVMLNDAVARIECAVVGKVSAGDHFVYLGEARGGSADQAAQPHVHIRKTAAGY
ncbi:MAG: flavin reductase family protein [Phycisphaerae bacterium]